ncbi:MAG TPA: nuclear transport factor 2 family protein [Solirubrobacteraceae bacterium]|nr:nuclear transport factor 2 family protein [Solirubrobacteraceae bacterium]
MLRPGAQGLHTARMCQAWSIGSENAELVEKALQAFATGGAEAAMPFLSPSVAWYPTDRWLDAPAYHGHDGMRELAAAFSDNFDEWSWEVHEIRDTQDLVVAAITMTARIKNSDSPISQPLGLVVSELHDGTIGEVRVFASWREALETAGVLE